MRDSIDNDPRKGGVLVAGSRPIGASFRHIRTLFQIGPVADLTDCQLLDRFAARLGEPSELAFAALVERHGPMVWRVCRRVLSDPHDADDAYQAAFLILARRAGSIRRRDSLASWLHKVALRASGAARADAARRRDLELRGAAMSARREIGPEPDDLGPALHEEIGRLPEMFRAAIVLCDLEGLTYEEAARRLRWPVGTVKSRLSRGRERLRARLVRRGLAPTAGAILTLLSAGSARAAAPAGLSEAAIKAATPFLATGRAAVAGLVPDSAARLAEGVHKAMTLTRILLGSTLAIVAGLGLAGVGVLGLAQARPQRDSPRPAPKPEAAPAPRPAPDEFAAERAEFDRLYALSPGVDLKRIGPPFPPSRLAFYLGHFTNKRGTEAARHVLSQVFRFRDGKVGEPLNFTIGGSGDPETEGQSLGNVLNAVAGISPQDVEGEEDLLKENVTGDWVVRDGAPPERVVARLGEILRKDCKLPVKLAFREVERDVIVARGRYKFRRVPTRPDRIELYGATLIDPDIGGGGSGSFDEFLRWAGSFIEPNIRILNEAEDTPKGQVSWHLNGRSPFTQQTRREDHDQDLVLEHLAAQTGLTFRPERRKVRVLFVEPAD